MLRVENRKSASGLGNISISPNNLARLQSEQHQHDLRNHFDIISLHKTDRLKHYGLHFAKYVGRLARGSAEEKSVDRTLVDAFLVSLSAANTLHQDLRVEIESQADTTDIKPWSSFADATGRFADACEKVDHMEEFVSLARRANLDIIGWIARVASERMLDLNLAVVDRRKELAARQFYIRD